LPRKRLLESEERPESAAPPGVPNSPEIPGCRLEANDLGAVNIAAGSAFVAGPHLNIYNEADAGDLCPLRHAVAGYRRWKATAG
jgi:hypothetical protein